MRQQTVLILDSQQHRGSMLERGLSGRDFHVFRTSRSREASKLLHIIQPHFVVLAWEGEGKEFYQQVVLEGLLGTSRCVIIALPGSFDFRDEDTIVDVRLASAALLDGIVRGFSSRTGLSGDGYEATRYEQQDDKTVMSLQPLPSPTASGPHLSHALQELEQWNDPPSASFRSSPSGQDSSVEPFPTALNVAYSLAMLAREQASGRVDIQTQKERCSFYLEQGAVVAVRCSQPIPSFPAWLLQIGILKPEDAGLVSELTQSNAPQRLLALRKIVPEQIHTMEQMYGEQCLLSCFPWTQGQLQFLRGETFPGEKKYVVPLASLVLQGVRQGYSRERLVELTGGFSQIPQWFTNESSPKIFELSDVEKHVLSLIDGHRSLIQIKDLVRCTPEMLLGVVYVCVIFGFLQTRDAEAIGSSTAAINKNMPRVPGQTGAHLVYGANPTPIVSAQPSNHSSQTSVPPRDAQTGQEQSNQSGSSTFTSHAPVVSFRSMVSPSRHGTMQARAFGAHPGTGGGAVTEPAPANAGLPFAEREAIEQKFYQVMVGHYFQILELSPDAQEGEIRRSYQQLKHAYARERFANPLATTTEAQLQEIRQVLEEAYTVLGDPSLRSRYIKHLSIQV